GPSADDPVGRPEADPGELAGLWVLPTVVGDTVYVNDGRWVSARDRFTLHPRWAVRPEQAALDGPRSPTWGVRPETFGRQIEDTTSVSVGAAGRVVIATTGIAWSGVRDGDRRTHAFDAATGRRLWSVDVWTLDPQLDGATVRGPALVDFAD